MKPTIPQGTRDFDAATMRRRQYILNTIKHVFEVHGYQPLETPAMENLDTLMGKYGEEGDKLIYRILDSGNPISKDFFIALQDAIKIFFQAPDVFGDIKIDKSDNFLDYSPEYLEFLAKFIIRNTDTNKKILPRLKTGLSNKALRYDLTIPFARYVAMNYNQLPMPFKRYQMQPVWRADRPQKGRYREFYQCDADVVGSTSLLNELELGYIYVTAFEQLKIPVEIRINNRKVLSALASLCGGADKMTDITVAIDKLDKIGIDKVKEELKARELTNNQITVIEQFLSISGGNEEKLEQLKKLFAENETGLLGIEELEYIASNCQLPTANSQLLIDPTLARGLNYYTGTIFEVKAIGVSIGSIGGGGRYDDLTGLFGVPNVPGVGISFGVDRIYDVLQELHLFPDEVQSGTQLLFFNMGAKESLKAVELANLLRSENISCEVYPENAKLDKQFKYADKKGIPYVAIIGSREVEEGMVNIKNLSTGEQKKVSFTALCESGFISF